MTWIRIDTKHPLRNPARRLYRRAFGWEGKLWPRATLTIYSRPEDGNAFQLSASFKEKPGAWWEDGPIPASLAYDAITLINEWSIAIEKR